MTTPTPITKKSCLTCPSYLKADRAVDKFKKNIGGPVCGRYGHVLGKPGAKPAQIETLAKHFGTKCPSHGDPLPPEPQERFFKVALPDPEVLVSEVNPANMAACTSCAMCKNFVRDDIVQKEFGWTTGLCSRWGKLILPNRQVYEARDCPARQFGRVRTDLDRIHLLPEYEDAFQLNVDPIKAYFKARDNFVEPHEYPTDRDVSDEERAAGIRAWRKVPDPEGSGNQVHLPIYDPNFFDEEERAKIPRTGDDEHPELYVDHMGVVYSVAVGWTELDETPAAWGEPGVGKTELFRHLAWLMCLPFERISITASSELDDLAGKMHYSPDKGTYFQYGRVPTAWGKPCVMVIDEPNTGPNDVWQFLRPMTDNSKQLVLDQNKGERVKRHDDCYLGLAMNPAWDPKNVGANEIGDADVSRLWHLFLDHPPEKLEREIIKERIKLDGWEIDDERLGTIMAVARELRGLSKEGTLPITWGIRPQIQVARASRWFELVTAYRRAVADYLEPEPQAALLDVVRAHVTSVF